MRSVRLEEALEKALVEAAAREGVSVSEFIRRAVVARVDLARSGPTTIELLGDFIGSVESAPGHEQDAENAELVYSDHLLAEQARRK